MQTTGKEKMMSQIGYESAIASACADVQLANDDDYLDLIDAWSVKIADLYDREPDDVMKEIQDALDFGIKMK